MSLTLTPLTEPMLQMMLLSISRKKAKSTQSNDDGNKGKPQQSATRKIESRL